MVEHVGEHGRLFDLVGAKRTNVLAYSQMTGRLPDMIFAPMLKL
jgi:hypothetical protein